MKCPKCGLINPDTALLCDCGWNFEDKCYSRPELRDHSDSHGSFRSGHLVANLVMLGFILIILLHILAIGSQYSQLNLISGVIAGRSVTPGEADAVDSRQQIIASAKPLAYIITSILFLIWFQRAYKNLSALGAFNLTYSPGWAIGGFFVPFLNLVRPYQVMKEIWRASDPETFAWRQAPTTPLVGYWWFLFLASSFLSRIVLQLSKSADSQLDATINYTKRLMFGDAFQAIAAIPAILLVLGIDKRQKKKHGLLPQLVLAGKTSNAEPLDELPKTPMCPNCQSPYDPSEYRKDALEWRCSNCGQILPKVAHE